MKFNISTKIFSWYYYIVIAIILIIGTVSSFLTYREVTKSTQETLLKNVASVASVFDANDIASFVGDDSDISNPAYLALKNKLEKIPQIDSDVRFVYLMGYRDSNVYFMVDSEPPTSADYSPPGQVYTEATDLDKAMFEKNLPSSLEMNTDRWGTWLSGLTPIQDPKTGKLLAVMGMDVSANKYFQTVYVFTAIPILSTIFMLLLFIIGYVLRKREQEFLTFKSELVSIASHEIRSPLTGISWLTLELLKDGSNLTTSQKEEINIIKSKSEILLLTINDLLDGTVAEKISKKKMPRKVINFKKLFEEIIADSSFLSAEKNLKVILDITVTTELNMAGDTDRIKRMFNNLLSNAIKYSKNGGIVIISADEKEKSIIFAIKDEGIGISPKDQTKIFNGFFRTDNAKKITENGTGLGLHYVRQIADLHDGRVWCESKENVGSTFYVELPKK